MAIYLVERGEDKGTKWINKRGVKKETESPEETPIKVSTTQDNDNLEDDKQARINIQKKASYDNKKRDIVAGKNLNDLEKEILDSKDASEREQLLDR